MSPIALEAMLMVPSVKRGAKAALAKRERQMHRMSSGSV